MKDILKKIAELEKRLEPEKINLKERLRKHELNKLDGGREEDEGFCSGMEDDGKDVLLKKYKY